MSGFYFNNNIVKIVECKHGTFMHFIKDNPIGDCLDFYGEWAEGEISFLSQFITTKTNIIDVGANIGTHTVFFSRACRQGYVYSIEPQFYIFQLLNANVVLNGCFNVKLYNNPVSNDFNEVKLLHLSPHSENGINYGEFKIHNAENGLLTKCIKLDEGFSNINLIKLDVEGHELSCLKSGDSLLKSDQPMLYVEFNNHSGNPELLDYLFNHGYECYWHITNKFNYPNFKNQTLNIWLDEADMKPSKQLIGKFFEANIFCVHKNKQMNLNLEKIKNVNDTFIKYLTRTKQI